MPESPLPPCVHARRAPLPPPLEALARLAHLPHPFLRVAAGPGFRGVPWSFLGVAPDRVVEVGPWTQDARLEEVLAPLRPRPLRRDAPVPFTGGWAGYLGYEARSGVEARPPPRLPPLGLPGLWWGRYRALLAWNHRRGEAWVVGEARTPAAARARADDLLRTVAAGATPSLTFRAGVGRALTDREVYLEKVRAAQGAIREGEIFQTNVSHRFEAPFAGHPAALFARFAAIQAAPYMTYLDLGEGRAVLSGSPERFVRVVGDRAETDPMKGTRPRGTSPAQDRRLRMDLYDSEKEKAELAMIVDLSRNDLSRVCRPGTVRVRVPRRLLRFPHVHQAIGVVTGRLEAQRDRIDLLQAAFPPGSVTGAPKVRAMEILDALEDEPRGPYCGALGWMDTGGDADLAVGIRTLLVGNGEVTWRVGGGITLRSDPEAEWEETLAKGRALGETLTATGAGT